ncbi:MAG: tRNA lysidine(34) synthetase TilS [Gammaproteobacteria bacterium]
MDFSPEALVGILADWPHPHRYVTLVSGGLDSTVLLHALAEVRRRLVAPLVVLHFDHEIAADSPLWARQVERMAETLGLPFFLERLAIASSDAALETRARSARYARLSAWMTPNDCCLTAHHADDQAETFLLQALRGAGSVGLAAMPQLRRFGSGWLGRPLLAWTRRQLENRARTQNLEWIEDPGNLDPAAARNWLRQRVWPSLTDRWPAASITLARSASQAAEAAALAAEWADEDLARHASASPDRLPIGALLGLGPARRRNLLRHWIRKRGLSVPTAAKLAELEREFIERDPGARATLMWPGAEAHRFRDMLHVLAPLPRPSPAAITLTLGEWSDLGPLGRVALFADPRGQMRPVVTQGALTLRFRVGGETLRPAGNAHHRPLKKLLQESAVLPWMRPRVPLLYVGDELAAVAGLDVAAEYAGRGWSLLWENAPPLR